MMRKIIAVIVMTAMLGCSACTTDEVIPGMASAMDAQQLANVAVAISDEEIPLAEGISFNEKSNEVLSIPTHVGGGMKLKIDGDLYDICYSYGDLALEKEGHVYKLWDTSLVNIVETATGKTLDALCAYTVTMNEKEHTVDGWLRRTVFDILTSVFDTRPVDSFDRQGECVGFNNKLGANFDLYLNDDMIYSPYLDACFDVSAYHDDFSDILASIK